MKIPVLVCFFFLTISALFCQERNTVNIYKKLLSIPPGAHQVEFLNNLALDSSSENPSIALFYAKLAVERARVFSDDSGLAKSYYNLGIIKSMNLLNNESNKTNEAINDFQSSIDIYTTILNKKGTKIEQKEKKRMIHRIAFARCGIGQIYSSTGKNYSEAILQLRAGLKSCESVGDSSGMARLFHTLGIVYYLVGIFPESLDNLLSALKILEKTVDKAGAADVSIQLGIVYRKLDLLTEALNNYNKSLSIFSKLGNNIEIAILLNNIGTIKYQQGKLFDALIYYHAAQELHSKLGEKNYLPSAFSNIGMVYSALGNYKEALFYLEKSLVYAYQNNNDKEIPNINNNIGQTYLKQKNYIKARIYLVKGLNLASNNQDAEEIRNAYRDLSSLDSACGDITNSLLLYKKYIFYRDSLLSLNDPKRTFQLQIKYDVEKKTALQKQEIEMAQKQTKRERLIRNLLITGIILLVIISFLLYLNFRTRQKLRVNDIRNRIAGDLHDDIGSTLNSISIYSAVAKQKSGDYDEALDMIGDASRKVIDSMSDIIWSINTENDSFEKIIFRMKSLAYNLFSSKKIDFTFQADEQIQEKKLTLEDRRNFYLIYKETINNLVKYSNATNAEISLFTEDGMLVLTISDNGVGFDLDHYQAGNGLKSMKRRAEEMKAEFNIESTPGQGTKTTLKLKR